MDVVEVYTEGGTAVEITANGQTVVNTTENPQVVVEAVAGVKGDTGASGFLLENNGTYPARPNPAGKVVFIGTINPDTLGVMQVGDSWINTAADSGDAPAYVRGNTDAPVIATNYFTSLGYKLGNTIGWIRAGSSSNYVLQSSGDTAWNGSRSLKFSNFDATASGGPQTTLKGLTPGTSYTMTFYSYVPVGDQHPQINFSSTSYGTTTINFGGQPGGSWVKRVHIFTPNSTSWLMYTTLLSGKTLYLDGFLLTETSPTTYSYFDGGTVGCRWTGAAYNSTSERLLPSADTIREISYGQALLVPSQAKYYEGIGFPEGAVTAPVGSRYIDTAATNGAVEWIKASGSGSTGWKVAYGDTGWRKLDTVDLINGWTTYGTSYVAIRRINGMVLFRIRGLSAANASSQQVYTAPLGFRPDSANGGPVVSNQSLARRAFCNVAGTVYIVGFATSDTYAEGHFQWDVDQIWPTTLPGVAG